MNEKPIKESVAFYALNADSAFLAIKRSDDDESLPGVWGLPAASVRPGESQEDAIKRAARDKLGLEVEALRYTGDDRQDRGSYNLHLSEYEVKIISGVPHILNTDSTTSHYAAFQWSQDPELLREAAERGSSCSRIFLRNKGLWPDGNKA